MKTFYQLLGNSLVVTTKNNFVWFALTYWAYLSTQSVVATGLVGGTFLVATAISSLWFGSLVDRYPKKRVLLLSNLLTLAFFVGGLGLLITNPPEVFHSLTSWYFGSFIVLLLAGTLMGSLYAIALPTLVTVLVPEGERDKANGMLGTVMGVSFAITSVASGIVLGFGGMVWVLGAAILLTLGAIAHLFFLHVPEPHHADKDQSHHFAVSQTIKTVAAIPGLFALIFYTTLNNFLGGVFMALMDAYGLTLVSVQVWGILWGFLSFGFIFGGLYIAKKGLGTKPLQTLFRVNMAIWTASIFFTIQPSIALLAVGALVWMCLVPFIEATEQTIIQKVVPAQKQGRVFGLAHSVEQAAAPLTAFLIGPITQFIFIPFMTTGKGAEMIGSWYGVGPGRGMALVFSLAGIVGLCVTIFAQRSRAYALLAARYNKQ